MKQTVINRSSRKGRSVNSVIITKTIEIEKNYDELLTDENRIILHIKHLEQELKKANDELLEITEIKASLDTTK